MHMAPLGRPAPRRRHFLAVIAWWSSYSLLVPGGEFIGSGCDATGRACFGVRCRHRRGRVRGWSRIRSGFRLGDPPLGERHVTQTLDRQPSEGPGGQEEDQRAYGVEEGQLLESLSAIARRRVRRAG